MAKEPSRFLDRMVPPLPHQLAEALPGPALLCDRDGRIRAWNQSALQATGYAPEEIAGLDPAVFFRGGQRRAFKEQMRAAREGGSGDLILPFQFPGGPAPEFRFRLLRLGDSREGWIALIATLAKGAQARREAGTFGNLVRNHPFGLLILRSQTISYANPALSELLDRAEPASFQGLSIASLVYREDREEMGRLLARAARDERPEGRIRMLDGDRRPSNMTVRLALLEGEESQPTIQMVVSPVSEREGVEEHQRRSEEREWFLLNRALRNSEQRFERLLERGIREVRSLRQAPAAETAPAGEGEALGALLAELDHGFWRGTLRSGTQVANEPFCSLLGRSCDDLWGTAFSDLVTPGEAPRVREILADLREGEVERFETRLRGSHYESLPVACQAIASSGGGPGEVPLNITVTDLSVETESAQELNWKNGLYESLFSQFPGFFCGISPDLYPSYWSPELPERLRLTPESLASGPITELLDSEDRETFQRLVREAEDVPFTTMETRLGEGASAVPYRLFITALPGDQPEAAAVLGINLAEVKNINPPLAGARARMAIEDRQTLERTLEREILRSQRYGNAFSVLLIEPDRLEEITEQYGPGWGDVIADQLQDVVEGATRGPDLVGRWEGRRILVVAPETSAASAAALATKIRKEVHRHDFDPVAWVKVRIGRASYRRGETAADLLARADWDLGAVREPNDGRTLA